MDIYEMKSEWLNTAVTSVTSADAHLESLFEVHDQRWGCWVLEERGISLSYIVLI